MRKSVSSETIQILFLLVALVATVLVSCLKGWC